jgi:hypothetical protein
MVVMFDRYRVLAWVGGSPYTVALIRDPDRGRARYLTCDRGAAAMYKNANVLTFVLEQATTNGLTVDGSEREVARRPLHGSEPQAGHDQVQPASEAGRRRRRPRAAPSRHRSREAATGSCPAN